MSKQLQNIIKGMGSVLDIYPSMGYSRYLTNINHSPQDDPFQIYAKNIGNYFRSAMSIADDEESKRAKAKNK